MKKCEGWRGSRASQDFLQLCVLSETVFTSSCFQFRLFEGCPFVFFLDLLNIPFFRFLAPRHMYWTDWDPARPRIERASLADGSGRIVVAGSGLTQPNGLTIDYIDNRLFWADAVTDKIESANLDGTDRQLVYNAGSTFHPFGLVSECISYKNVFFSFWAVRWERGFLSFFFFLWQSGVLHGIMSAFIKSLFSCKPFWKSFVIAELCRYISDPRRRRSVFFSRDVDILIVCIWKRGQLER